MERRKSIPGDFLKIKIWRVTILKISIACALAILTTEFFLKPYLAVVSDRDYHDFRQTIHTSALGYKKTHIKCSKGHITDRLSYFEVYDSVNEIPVSENVFLQKRINSKGNKGKRTFQYDHTKKLEVSDYFRPDKVHTISLLKKNIPIVADSWVKGDTMHAIVNLAYIINSAESNGMYSVYMKSTYTCEYDPTNNELDERLHGMNSKHTTISSAPFIPELIRKKGVKDDYFHLECQFPKDTLSQTSTDLSQPLFFDIRAVAQQNIKLFHFRNVHSCRPELPEKKPEVKVDLCVMLNGKNKQFLMEWIAYHIHIGFDHIHVYANEDPWVYQEMLKEYEAANLVTVIDWNSLSMFQKSSPTTPTGFFDQLSQIGSCVHRSDGVADFLGLWDVDEFMQIAENESGSAINVKEAILDDNYCEMSENSVGSGEISSQFFGCYNGEKYDKKNLPKRPCVEKTKYNLSNPGSSIEGFSMLNSAVYRANTVVAKRKRKMIVRPEKIKTSSIHMILGYNDKKSTKTTKCSELVRLVHYKKAKKGVFYLETNPGRMPKGYSTEPIQQDTSFKTVVPAVMEMVSKYLNVPFCQKNPDYCGFVRLPSST